MWYHFETCHHEFQTYENEYILSTEITRKKLSDPLFMKSLKDLGVLKKSCKNPISAKISMRTSENSHLFLVQNGVAVFKLSY